MSKDERDLTILNMFNSGSSEREISDIMKMSKSGVHRVLSNYVGSPEVAPKKVSVKVKLTGNEEVFNNFSGWARTDVNQYAHKETGEAVNLVFIPADSVDGFGKFVKV
jgi:hypothetical protein